MDRQSRAEDTSNSPDSPHAPSRKANHPASAGPRSIDGDPIETIDPALDPEIARIAKRVAGTSRATSSLAVLGFGWAVVFALIGGILGGVWLDGQLGTSPWLTLLGTAFGLLFAGLTVRSLIAKTRR